MKKNLEVLAHCALFANITESELISLLSCLSAKDLTFKKGEFLFIAGDSVLNIGIILSGNIQIIKEDYWGNRHILTGLGASEIFAEAFSCAELKRCPVSAVATEDTTVMLIDYKKIITTCPNSCIFHTKLIHNMIGVLAQKNIALTEKMNHLTKKTTGEKLLSYLSEQSRQKNSSTFDIPFNRQELADYLSVDRSAMSYELSKLQKMGVIEFRKNHFELL
jgi:CRP-like cAMP-binding protein